MFVNWEGQFSIKSAFLLCKKHPVDNESIMNERTIQLLCLSIGLYYAITKGGRSFFISVFVLCKNGVPKDFYCVLEMLFTTEQHSKVFRVCHGPTGI